MFFFDFLKAEITKANKKFDKPPIRTNTPIPELSQASMVKFNEPSFIMIETNGSLFKALPETHNISMIGKLSFSGLTFYRTYLSQGDGAYIHLVTSNLKSNEIVECRLYQPYHEIIPLYADAAVAGADAENTDLLWSNWLLDNSDPALGGIIGCPTVNGKPQDIDATTDAPYLYYRSWGNGSTRIQPKVATEELVAGDGNIVTTRHRMMHYERLLKDNSQREYLLISASETNPNTDSSTASIVYWLGIDLDRQHDLTVYSPPK